nr:hypothetical protein [Tanacetum cinerariifolium]
TSGNTKKDKIQRPPSSTQKNKVEAHPRTVKSSLKNKNYVVEPKGTAIVQHSKLNANSKLICVRCNGCMLSDNHDLYVLNVINDVVQIVLWYLDSGCSKHTIGDRSQLTNFVNKFLGTVKFGNDHVAKIMGYRDYQIGNITISRVYYVEGLGHNLFSVGIFCDSNLEVAFRQHNSRRLWHRRLSHLNFGALNHLARYGLIRGLPKLKFEKDHLCSACSMGKSKKKPHKPKSKDVNQEKLYLLHMDLCGPMRVASINGNKYILVIIDDYSRFTWVKCSRSKDEAPDFIIKFLKMIQLRLKTPVRRIRTDNGTEFVNQTLREYYEKLIAIASEYNSFEPTLHEMTPATISFRLVPNPPPSTPYVPVSLEKSNKNINGLHSLKSQLETQKTQFLNEIDRLSREYYYADHMNAILGVYTELDEDLKAQLQDKSIVISELKKLIAKLKGKSVDTKFGKASVIRQPNAFKSQRPSSLGKPTIFSDSLERKDFSKSKSVTQNNVSNDFSKPVTAYILPPNKKSILKNTNVLAPGMYKLHTELTQTRTSQLPYDSRKSNKLVSYSTGVIPTTNVSRPKLKSNPMKDRVLLNNTRRDCPIRSSKHMTGNLKLLINFVEKFLGTVKFRNDQIAPILGYGDLVQGAIMIKWVYYVEGLNHNLFSVGQFCDADLDVAFRKSTCYIRDLKGNDLLTGSRGIDLYSIILQDINSPNPICLMAKATSSQAWLWHRRLSHLNFDTINLQSKNDIVVGLPKLKFVKDHRCYSCNLGKAKRKSKDETPEVLIDFLRLVQRGLHAQVRIVRTDKGTEFLNKTLHAYFASEGILYQTSVARTPEQNGIIERRNRTLVEAARTMLSASKVPLFFWAEAIATTCFTQNRSLVIPRHEKTPYHIINDRKPSVKFFHIFGSLCYIVRDGEKLDKMKEKGDACIFMASDHVISDPAPECPRTALEHGNLSPSLQCQEHVPHAAKTVTTSNELDLLFSPMFDELLNGSSKIVSKDINTIVTGVELCKQKIAKPTYYGHINPFIKNTIEQNFCPVISKINVGLHLFLKRLNEEMVVDLRYFNSLELEVDSFTSQLETQKTQFVKEIDCLSREYYYADHMNAILGVYTELDEVTNLQCDYLELLQKCECLETELSKSKMMSKSFESDLKAQLQDKSIVIRELKKLIEKLKGKSVDTKFEKSSVIRQPNAFKSQRPSVLGKPTTFSNSFIRKDFSKSTSVTQSNVSNDFSKPVTAQTLPTNKKPCLKNTDVLASGMYKLHTDHTRTRTSQSPQDFKKTNKRVSFSTGVIPTTSVSRPQLKSNPQGDRVLRSNSRGKKLEVEEHRRNVKLPKNKTSVTACNDSLNAKTVNVKYVFAMCDKCVLHDKHDMCVLKSVAKPLMETFTPSGNIWKPKSGKENVNPNVSIPLGKASRTANVMDTMTSRSSIVSNTPLSSNSFATHSDCPIHRTVKFGNDQIAPILGYGDLVQGAVTIKRVYYIEGLNYNLFSVGQFCDTDSEVAFRKSTCFIRDLKGNDLLTGSRGIDLYSITLQGINSPNPICLMAKATSSQAWKIYERVSKTCSWWYPKFTPSGYIWKPKSGKENVNPNLIDIVLFIVDSGCSKHMTGNLKLLINFVEKFLETVKFRNDQIAPILRYGDLVQGAVTIKRVYYVEGLIHNLFSVGQFCDADLEVAFRKSTCFIRDLKGNNLLTDHLCSSCELGKAKRKSFHTKLTPSSNRWLHLLHMDLCGPMRVASINGKRYVLVIVDDYSRYTWTHFLRSKDETPEVLIDFLRLVQRGLQAQVRVVRTDKGTEFLNQTLHAYFDAEGILHQTSVARTPKQNGLVERRNRTLVEAARTMLSAAKVSLFFWAEAIATACFTQNRSLVIPRHEKTPYHIINDRKPSVKFFHIFGSVCYIVRDGENLDKMKEKGDECIFVGYSNQSRAYKVFNKRTRVIMESIHINFDELPQMASVQISSDPAPECQTMALEHDSLSLGRKCQENVSHGDKTVTTLNELDLLFRFEDDSSDPGPQCQRTAL